MCGCSSSNTDWGAGVIPSLCRGGHLSVVSSFNSCQAGKDQLGNEVPDFSYRNNKQLLVNCLERPKCLQPSMVQSMFLLLLYNNFFRKLCHKQPTRGVNPFALTFRPSRIPTNQQTSQFDCCSFGKSSRDWKQVTPLQKTAKLIS